MEGLNVVFQKLKEEWSSEKFSSLLNQETLKRFSLGDFSQHPTPIILRFLMSILSLRKNGLKEFSVHFAQIFKNFRSKKNVDEWIRTIIEILSQYLTQQCLTIEISSKEFSSILMNFENFPKQISNLKPLYSPFICKSFEKIEYENNVLNWSTSHNHFNIVGNLENELLSPLKLLKENLKEELFERKKKIQNVEMSPTRPKFNFEQNKQKKSNSGIFISRRSSSFNKSSSRRKKKELERKKKEKLRKRKKAIQTPKEKGGIQMIEFSESVLRMNDITKRSRKRKRDTTNDKEKPAKKKKVAKREKKNAKNVTTTQKNQQETQPTDANPFSKTTEQDIIFQPQKEKLEKKSQQINPNPLGISKNPPSSIFSSIPSSLLQKPKVPEKNVTSTTQQISKSYLFPPSATIPKQFQGSNNNSSFTYRFTPSNLFKNVPKTQKENGSSNSNNITTKPFFSFNQNMFKTQISPSTKSDNPKSFFVLGEGNSNKRLNVQHIIPNPKNLTPIQPKIVAIQPKIVPIQPVSTIVGKHFLPKNQRPNIFQQKQKKNQQVKPQKQQIIIPPQMKIFQPTIEIQKQKVIPQPKKVQQHRVNIQQPRPQLSNPQQNIVNENKNEIKQQENEKNKEKKKENFGTKYFPTFQDIKDNRI